MERILSVEQMQAADRYTIEKLGISEEILIERAGRAVAEEITRRFRGGRVLVCIGKGNNGKDGEVIASVLSGIHGFSVNTLSVSNGIFKMLDIKFDIIVDCIFGTGLNREVEGKYKTAIEKINASGAFIVACDIASGLNGNTGKPMGTAVKADLTVAIQEYKLGHFLNDGPDYSGEVIAKDIGISIWGEDYAYRLSGDDAKVFFEKRKRNVNKGNFGKALVIGGSKKFPGSILLSYSALCALRAGAGYCTLAVPESLYGVYSARIPECIMETVPDNGESMIFDEKTLSGFLSYSSISVGMGMGVSEEIYKILKYLIENYTGNLVIDADGLNALSKFGTEILKNKKCDILLTPHVGEFARLLKAKKDIIMSDIINLSKEFARRFGIVLLAKSAVSVITDGEKTVINTTGSPCMAKGGSGDVLSGFAAGIFARNPISIESASTAAYIFGRAGEICEKEQNTYTVIAEDLIRALPRAINSL